MSISIADNFSYKGNKPLDSRFQFPSISTMKAAPTADLYDGCMAYVVAEKKNYQYDSSNEYDTTLGKWREFSGGGGGGTGSSGSVFDITTQEETLYGKTVTITDGEHVWQGTFDSTGHAQVQGVTSVGELTISSSDGSQTIEMVVTIEYYSNYVYDLSDIVVYGFMVDATKATDNVSYEVKYDGNDVVNYNFDKAYMNFTTGAWVWGDWTGDEFFMPRPVLISQDYSRKIYLNPNDYTYDVENNDVTSYLTGAVGDYNAMMEWGKDGRKIWYKIVPDSTNNGATVYISDEQVDSGFHAYSFIGSDGTTLNDHFYTPIYNGSVVNSKLRSISSQNIMNNVAGGTEITYATANGTGYYIETFADRILINLLLMLIGKNTNTQATFGNGHYSATGQASSLLQSGTMNNKGLFYGTNGTGVGVKVFGMENYWGNQWRRMAGYLNVSGTQKYKLTAPYNDSGSNYTTLPNGTPDGTTGGYLSKMIYTEDGAMVSKTASGSNSTFYTDVFHFNNSQTDYAVVGGASDSSLGCGAFSFNLGNGLSAAAWAYGAALSYHA